MLNIIRPALPESCRIICVSDIHTHWDALDKLLKNCGYKKNEDFLFILGDILERGEDNIQALRYCMQLAKNERVYIIEGNNDTYVTGLALRYDDEKFWERFSRKQGCFGEMAKAIGITDFSENIAEKRRAVYEAFKTEIDFIHSLPEAIETEHHIFVHAGIPDRPDWQNCGQYEVMLIPRFVDLSHQSEKTVICGHFPTYALGRQNSNLPIFDFERRIIDIDGGAGVKAAGQINALIIEKQGSDYSYSTQFRPIGKQCRIIENVKGYEDWIFADYEKHSFTLMTFSPDNNPVGFIDVKNNLTGEIGIVPECMSGYWDNTLHVWGNLNAFPSVKKGEPVWIYSEYSEYCWCITASGEVGSVPKKVIDFGE